MKELHRTAKQDKITGGATSITSSNLTASRALVSDGSGKVAASATVTSTELGYLDGVTSNIQTQLKAKAAASDLTSHSGDTTKHITAAERTAWNAKQDAITGAASTITTSNLTASMVMVTDGSGKVAASSNITTSELSALNNYLVGEKGNIKTRFEAVESAINNINAGIYPSFNTSETLEHNVAFIPTVNGLLHYTMKSDARSGGYSMYLAVGSTTFTIWADDYSHDTGFIPVAAGTVIKYTFPETNEADNTVGYQPGTARFYPCS